MTFPLDDAVDDDPGIPFLDTTHRRRLVMLVLDVSKSMTGILPDGRRAIDALNEQVERWLPRLHAEGRLALRDAEFAVVALGEGGVEVLSGTPDESVPGGGAFVRAGDLTVKRLTAGGASPLVPAIDLALRRAEERRRWLQESQSLQVGTPRVIVVSDGVPTDEEGNPTDDWRRLAARLTTVRSGRGVVLYAFGMPGSDETVLRALATDEGYFPVTTLDFGRLLDLILVATTANGTHSYQAVVDALNGEGV